MSVVTCRYAKNPTDIDKQQEEELIEELDEQYQEEVIEEELSDQYQ